MLQRAWRLPAAVLTLPLVVVPFAVSACGGDDGGGSDKATTLSITTSDVGKGRFKTQVPKSIEGGLVRIEFRNASKVRHEAQLLRLEGGHSLDEALKIVGEDKPVIPAWLHAAGGLGAVAPGASGSATLELQPGRYAMIDTESEDGPPPALRGARATFKVKGDNGAELEETDSKVEAKDKGDDEFEFVTSDLKPGTNELTFDNLGKELHHVVAAPLKPNATIDDVKKALLSEKGPPPIVERAVVNTAVLDGKTKETTQLKLRKGRYALICFLTDRDGKGKPHWQEGMLKEVDVK
jgi:hypothetical protein